MTALFDARSFAVLDGLRRRHFPPALNMVPAHATLFHKLPGEEYVPIARALAEVAAQRAPVQVTMARTLFLGRGVALALDAPDLAEMRDTLAFAWKDRLSTQDRHAYRPHVTIQNKVAPALARETQARLEARLPIEATIEGLALWHYRGGPWEAAGRFRFAA